MTRVFFQIPPGPAQSWEGPVLLEAVWRMFVSGPPAGWGERPALAETAAEADLVVFLESNYFKTRGYADLLRGVEAIRRWPEKCFTVNTDDGPLPFLPGVYTGLPARWFDERRAQASGYLTGSPNPFCAEYEARRGTEPEWLFSFRGARSAPVRERLFAQAERLTKGLPANIHASPGWFNHTEEEMRIYLNEIIRSRFVICPRGQGTASHRLFEVLQLGRVPVILSDEWVPPRGPDWAACSIRIRERDLALLPRRILEREPEFAAMARAARATWERWFSPERRLWVMLDALGALQRGPRVPEAEFRRQWDRSSFYRANLGTFWERATRRLLRMARLK